MECPAWCSGSWRPVLILPEAWIGITPNLPRVGFEPQTSCICIYLLANWAIGATYAHSDVYSWRLISFLTAFRKEIVVSLSLAARKPELGFSYRSAALAAWRARLYLNPLP